MYCFFIHPYTPLGNLSTSFSLEDGSFINWGVSMSFTETLTYIIVEGVWQRATTRAIPAPQGDTAPTHHHALWLQQVTHTLILVSNARCFYIYLSFSRVPICHHHHGYIMNSLCDQLSDGLIARSVEHCTGIAEVMGSNPVQAWIFFFSGFNFTTAQVVCITAMINNKLNIFVRSSNIWSFIYSFTVYVKVDFEQSLFH